MKHSTSLKLAAVLVTAAILTGVPAAAGDWELLGKRVVTFATDRDVIKVTAAEGTFRKLRLDVRRKGIHMLDMKVVFGDGSVQDVSLKQFIPAGKSSRVIDLRGAARVVKRVELVYKTKARGRKVRSEIKLYGKH